MLGPRERLVGHDEAAEVDHLDIEGRERRDEFLGRGVELEERVPIDGGIREVAGRLRFLRQLCVRPHVRSSHRLPLPVLRKLPRELAFELLARRELERVDAQRIATGLDARLAEFAIDLAADLGGAAQLRFREEAALDAALLLGQAVVGLLRAGQLGRAVGQHGRAAQAGAGAGVFVLLGKAGGACLHGVCSSAKSVAHEAFEGNDGVRRCRLASERVVAGRERIDPRPLLVIRYLGDPKGQSPARRDRTVGLDDGIGHRLQPILAVVRHPGLRALPVQVALHLVDAKHRVCGRGIRRQLCWRGHLGATRQYGKCNEQPGCSGE
jgi:hypothetical protein